MKRDWRPTIALIAALLFSFGLTWMGREVGAHVARDAELIAQLTMDERPFGAVRFVSPPLLIDARNVDASASDAGAFDAYEATDLAAPVIRRYCDALLNRLCTVWSACGCEGTPPHWPFDETEVGTCAEVMRPHCENWSVWTRLREQLARSSIIVDEAALVQFETDVVQAVDCNGARDLYPVLAVNDATEGQPCNQQASYECRDGSDCVEDVCTVLPGQGERCLNEQEEDAEDDPCASHGLCAEGLVCARHRCTPTSRFNCILEPLDFHYVGCPPGEVFNWRGEVARALPECMPIGRACTSDAACFRSRCAGERTSVCTQPTTHDHPRRLLRTAAVLDGYQGNDGDLPTASVGEECRSHICAEGLSCSVIAVDDGESAAHVAFVCREPLAEGGDCSGGDCAEGLVCVDVVHNGHCTAPVCEIEYLF